MTCIRLNRLLFTLCAFCIIALSNISIAAEKDTVPTLFIKGETVKLEHFKMGYFVDKDEQMFFDEARKQEYTVTQNGLSLGTASKSTWVKIELKNANPLPMYLYLHHPYAYHNSKVELYEVVDDELVRTRILDMDMRETQRWMYRGSAVFDIPLQGNQHKTLYVKSVAFSHQWFKLNIYDQNLSKRALLGQYTDIAILAGMLLALIIYNFLLFFSSRLKEHFYYACYLISGGFWIALSYGLLADVFDVYGTITLKWHLSLVSMPIFILLFMTKIFDTKKLYPIEHKALVTIIILLTLQFIYGLFDIITALKYSSTLAAIMMLVSLSVTVSMLIRKHPIALFFLLGHGVFVIFSGIAVLFYKGIIEFNYVTSHGVGIGIVLEALVLSLIIAHRIKSLERMKDVQADLQVQASTDPLTHLFNRRYFNEASLVALQQGNKTNQSTAVALIDIDHFKKINDTYGHLLGDQTIKQVAEIIRKQSRHQDILARYGGEEFVVLMPNTFLNEAYNIAERIRRKIESTSLEVNDEQSINITVSIGVANVPEHTQDLQDAINRADKALYKAKNQGRNQSRLYAE